MYQVLHTVCSVSYMPFLHALFNKRMYKQGASEVTPLLVLHILTLCLIGFITNISNVELHVDNE